MCLVWLWIKGAAIPSKTKSHAQQTGLDLDEYNCLSTAVAFRITWLPVVCWFVNTRPKIMDLSASFLTMPSLRIGVPPTGGNFWNFDFPKSVYNDNLETTLGQLKDNCETKRDLGTTIGETTFRRNVLWASYNYLFFYFLPVHWTLCSGKLGVWCDLITDWSLIFKSWQRPRSREANETCDLSDSWSKKKTWQRESGTAQCPRFWVGCSSRKIFQ